MAAQMLEAACHNVHADDQEAEPVVTALGSGGRYYICTRTRSNEYKQHFHGLPKALEEWLFPADGSTRHLETLQVILIGDDGFWASDKDGELRSKAGRPNQRLKRPLTWHGQQRRSAEGKRSQQGGRTSSSEAASEAAGEAAVETAVDVADDDEPTWPPAVPVAMALTRSRTSGVSGTWPRPVPDERRVEVLRREAIKRRRSRLSVDEGATYPTHVMPPLPLAVVAAPRYADAGVQTDSSTKATTSSGTSTRSSSSSTTNSSRSGSTSSSASTSSASSSTSTSSSTVTTTSNTTTSSSHSTSTTCPCRCRPAPASRSRHSRASSSSSSSSIYLAASDAHAHALVCQSHDAWPRKTCNPVAMGQLQEYFRSTSYTLGDALERVGMG
ncbi:hypothetical protein CDD82_6179 [Ophiocordyceps australis]|uniref:Uncharacterized protein n=1 Tax=Ophiocordyceps australis TaxID=1399860 RepID=A0A2C5YTJ4_9HYPO|nr:hypothetical protein CDD82_6179 [Ophiocordyceps australis]